MEPHGFLQQALVYLAAGVIAVPLCKRLGLGSVLGYLVAGMAIGPWGLRLIADPQTVLQFSEFGVVLLLFLIGLERSEEHTSELQSRRDLVCRLLLEKKKKMKNCRKDQSIFNANKFFLIGDVDDDFHLTRL